MFGFGWLDIPLFLLLLWQFIYGWKAGFVLSLCSVIGFAAGAIAAFFALPLVNTWLENSSWRLAAVIGAVVVLIAIGYSLGAGVGQLLSRGVRIQPLRAMNRVLGAVASLIITALIVMSVSLGVSALGVPWVSQAIGQSAILRTIDSWTPAPVQQVIAQWRSAVIQQGIPQLFETLGPAQPVAPPDARVDTVELNNAARSVLRITGMAFQCGQNQTGTGFVVAPGKVVTNAHVIAGVNQPVVEAPGGALPGRVVYFDPQQDIAVIAVDGLDLPAIPLGTDLPNGSMAAVEGYPFGGPFQTKPASVSYRGQMMVPDIYRNNPQPQEVYQLAADVQPGNSGGPLLSMDGRVAGVIFAKSDSNQQVGYAFTLDQVSSVLQNADGMNAQVSSGRCTAG
ncbi:MarP family serine protease [Acaricomes phytoseiuli]|uniref:MarP family serine protease n=1 Tax=Acaricomes phytoseiuli TaxID=291968 RepID=UPI0003717354|nr:MarP family serine protease [Acaricomes phytoseiuli]